MSSIEIPVVQSSRHGEVAAIRIIIGLALAIVLLGVPFVVPDYQTFQLTGVMIYAVAALGLNLSTGYVGQVSLGHNAFFALGSYAAMLSVVYLRVNDVLAVL